MALNEVLRCARCRDISEWRLSKCFEPASMHYPGLTRVRLKEGNADESWLTPKALSTPKPFRIFDEFTPYGNSLPLECRWIVENLFLRRLSENRCHAVSCNQVVASFSLKMSIPLPLGSNCCQRDSHDKGQRQRNEPRAK